MARIQALGARYDELNATHATLIRKAISTHGGQVVRSEGDAFFAVFADAPAAARAAIAIQRAMSEQPWPVGHPLRVRIGLHSGSAFRAGDDYGGFEVNRAARIAAAGHGGQIVMSDATRALVAADVPDDATFRDLGSHRLRGLSEPERLFQMDAPGLERAFEPLSSGAGPGAHLPDRMTSFIGRERELEELSGLLSRTRLLTLTGPGGSGKTTLAVELARRHAGDFADGARFVDLQGVTDPDTARARIAHDMGLLDGPAGTAVERLPTFIAERELMVVADNLEQVDGGADVIAELLGASRSLRVVATSRAPLRLSAEQEYAVRPMRSDPNEHEREAEAVRLFIDRARRVRPDLRLDDTASVTEICRLVDGLPLAIELSAARVTILPVARIRDRLAERLTLPGSGPRDLPERQRTIESTVAWSYDLLDEPLRKLFRRLGVFGETFELEQAEQICGPASELDIDVLDGIATLVEHSLLNRLDDAVGGVRFGMLMTIRAQAEARLEESSEADDIRTRHAQAYLDLVSRLFPSHHNPSDPTWLDRLEPEDDNLRRAIGWAIDSGDSDLALGIVGYLWRYWVHGGQVDTGRHLAEAALAMPGADRPSTARAWGVGAAGSLAYWSDDWERAISWYREQLSTARMVNDDAAEADAWYSLIYCHRTSGDEDAAVDATDHARRILQKLGDHERLDELDASLALMLLPSLMRDAATIGPILERHATRLGSSSSQHARLALPGIHAALALARGDLVSANRHYVEGMRMGLRWHQYAAEIVALSFYCAITATRLEPRIPATLLGVVDAARERYGVRGPDWREVIGQPDAPAPDAWLREQMGDPAFEAAFETGRSMTLTEAVDFLDAEVRMLEGSAG